MICYHVLFTGKVQGVGFRYFVCCLAGDLGVKGWVRNLPDTSVEVMAESNEPDLKRLIEGTQSHFQSFVREVHLQTRPATGSFDCFSIVD